MSAAVRPGFKYSGIIAPVVTPFGENGAPDAARFIAHCQWLLDEGCTALLPFGTTSEATSLGLDERMALLEAMVLAQIDPALILVGTGTCSTTDTALLCAHARDLGCGGVLTLPPFYYKAPSDDGLFRFYGDVIEAVGDDRLAVYLYHIPQQTMIGFSPELVTRLVEAFPRIVTGLKDSSGDWENMKKILDLKLPGFEFFPGSETHLLQALKLGAAGTINAYANLNPQLQRLLYDNWRGDTAQELQSNVSAFRQTMSAYPMIPAIKAVLAQAHNDPRWAYLRPPFDQLSRDDSTAIVSELRTSHDFSMSISQQV